MSRRPSFPCTTMISLTHSLVFHYLLFTLSDLFSTTTVRKLESFFLHSSPSSNFTTIQSDAPDQSLSSPCAASSLSNYHYFKNIPHTFFVCGIKSVELPPLQKHLAHVPSLSNFHYFKNISHTFFVCCSHTFQACRTSITLKTSRTRSSCAASSLLLLEIQHKANYAIYPDKNWIFAKQPSAREDNAVAETTILTTSADLRRIVCSRVCQSRLVPLTTTTTIDTFNIQHCDTEHSLRSYQITLYGLRTLVELYA